MADASDRVESRARLRPVLTLRTKFARKGLVTPAVVATFVLAGVLLPGMSAASARGAAWGARVAVPGRFGALYSAFDSLYAAEYTSTKLRRVQIARIDPETRRVVARSEPMISVVGLASAGGGLWALDEDGASRKFFGLSEYSPASLKYLGGGTISVGSSWPVMTVGGAGTIWIASETLSGSLCSVTKVTITSHSMKVTPGPKVRASTCSAVAASGPDLYVVTQRPPNGIAIVTKVEIATGEVLATASTPLGNVSVWGAVATPTTLWIASEDPGSYGGVTVVSSKTLKTLGRPSYVSGPGFATQLFGQFPQIDESGGVIWVGSDGQLACFNSASFRPNAVVEQTSTPPLVTGGFRVIGGSVWANSDEGGVGGGLAIVTPPRSCFSG